MEAVRSLLNTSRYAHCRLSFRDLSGEVLILGVTENTGHLDFYLLNLANRPTMQRVIITHQRKTGHFRENLEPALPPHFTY